MDAATVDLARALTRIDAVLKQHDDPGPECDPIDFEPQDLDHVVKRAATVASSMLELGTQLGEIRKRTISTEEVEGSLLEHLAKRLVELGDEAWLRRLRGGMAAA